MKRARRVRLFVTVAWLLLGSVCAWAGDDFPPVRPLELAMQKDAANPSEAEILYHESRTNNLDHSITEYYRIKIFTAAAAKKYGDVTIPYNREFVSLLELKARTVLPDGTIVPFNGKIFDRVLYRRRGFQVLVATFAFPNVQPGCILEYRYQLTWDRHIWLVPRWIVQEELPQLQAKFFMNIPPGTSLAPVADLGARYDYSVGPSGSLELTATNVPPFAHEEFSLPDEFLKKRVLFYPVPEHFSSETAFWREVGKRAYKDDADFAGPRKGVVQEVAKLVQSSDPPEAKLRKLYARAQQLRDLSYEPQKTEAEAKREKLKRGNNAEQVLQNGYGYRDQINLTFVALARAAGFEAATVYVNERYEYPFDSRVLDASQLRWLLAVVKVDGKERYFDPGTPGCPFGLLPWEDTLVKGLRPTPDGAEYVTTPLPSPEASQRLRKADLTVQEDGSLHGRLSMTCTGQFALDERLNGRQEDEVGRHKQLEGEIREWLPSQSQVKVEKISGWEEAEHPLQVEATLDIPGVAAPAGGRLILPADIFEVNRKNPFEAAERQWDVYLTFPDVAADDLTLHLPAGYQVEALTPSQEFGGGVRLHYQVSRSQAGGEVHIQRQSRLNDVFFESTFYPALRQFYSREGAADEEPIVLRAVPGTQGASAATRKP